MAKQIKQGGILLKVSWFLDKIHIMASFLLDPWKEKLFHHNLYYITLLPLLHLS